MDFSTILSKILYGISGFCFGIFASRFSIFSLANILLLKTKGFSGENIIRTIPFILFLALAFFIFPIYFINKTEIGGYVYYVALLLFFTKGFNNLRK